MLHHFTNRPNRIGWWGVGAVGAAIAISTFSAVHAEHAHSAGMVVYDCSRGGACVVGNSNGTKTWGVYGAGSFADGVHGVTSSTTGNSGTSGISDGTTGSGHGVYGKSSNGQGVYGTSSSSNGVEGHSTASSKSGVYGEMNGFGMGVTAESNDKSGDYAALYASALNKNTAMFQAYNSSWNSDCAIDPHANLTCTGTITGSGSGSLRARHLNASGQHVLTYASESATETIEDFGTARMAAGFANVQISSDFASLMDHHRYYVFLTALGDTRGLYVSIKTPTGFQVREMEHGRSTLEFDYRIVAHPLDAKEERLPIALAIKRPINADPVPIVRDYVKK